MQVPLSHDSDPLGHSSVFKKNSHDYKKVKEKFTLKS